MQGGADEERASKGHSSQRSSKKLKMNNGEAFDKPNSPAKEDFAQIGSQYLQHTAENQPEDQNVDLQAAPVPDIHEANFCTENTGGCEITIMTDNQQQQVDLGIQEEQNHLDMNELRQVLPECGVTNSLEINSSLLDHNEVRISVEIP